MNERYIILDYIRVITIIMIVTCHYFLYSNLDNGIGRYLAGVGNMLFFMLSAFLYGYKYKVEKESFISSGIVKPFNAKRFIIKRIIRLGSSLWPYLFTLSLLFFIFEIRFSWIDLILNLFFLGYLGKLPGNGHLWFLTVMMACYFEYVIFNKFQVCSRFYSFLYLFVSLLLMICLELYSLPGNFIAILGFFSFFVVNYNLIVQSINKMTTVSFLLFFAINILLLYLSLNHLFEQSRITHYLLSDICGCLLLLLFLKVLPNRSNRIILFISNISFEIYLVHHTLCSGPFFRISSLTNNHFINYLLLLLLSLVFAILLKMVSKIINKLFNRLLSKNSMINS